MVDVEPESETCPDCGSSFGKEGVGRAQRYRYPSAEAGEDHVSCSPNGIVLIAAAMSTPQPPGVLPKSLYGNQFIADAVEMHYLHGVPMGRISEYLGIGPGSLVKLFRRCADLFERLPDRLIEEYRKAPVKHADETGWRTDGKNGYVWLFATPDLSIFQFGKNRSSKVPQAVFGKDPSAGDARCGPLCRLQQGSLSDSILLCPSVEGRRRLGEGVSRGSGSYPPLWPLWLPSCLWPWGFGGSRSLMTSFIVERPPLRDEIKATMAQPAKHLGIRRIQDIFRENEHRLFHWADNRAVPADNNLAERDLRPSVIARKVSFGSITDAGAKVRSTLTTVAATIKKRGGNVGGRIKEALDLLARNPKADPFEVLFSPSNPP